LALPSLENLFTGCQQKATENCALFKEWLASVCSSLIKALPCRKAVKAVL